MKSLVAYLMLLVERRSLSEKNRIVFSKEIIMNIQSKNKTNETYLLLLEILKDLYGVLELISISGISAGWQYSTKYYVSINAFSYKNTVNIIF